MLLYIFIIKNVFELYKYYTVVLLKYFLNNVFVNSYAILWRCINFIFIYIPWHGPSYVLAPQLCKKNIIFVRYGFKKYYFLKEKKIVDNLMLFTLTSRSAETATACLK